MTKYLLFVGWLCFALRHTVSHRNCFHENSKCFVYCWLKSESLSYTTPHRMFKPIPFKTIEKLQRCHVFANPDGVSSFTNNPASILSLLWLAKQKHIRVQVFLNYLRTIFGSRNKSISANWWFSAMQILLNEICMISSFDINCTEFNRVMHI